MNTRRRTDCRYNELILTSILAKQVVC